MEQVHFDVSKIESSGVRVCLTAIDRLSKHFGYKLSKPNFSGLSTIFLRIFFVPNRCRIRLDVFDLELDVDYRGDVVNVWWKSRVSTDRLCGKRSL